MKNWFKVSFVLAAFIANMSSADIYQIYWPEENMADPENNPNDTSWQAVKITNVSSNTVIDGSMTGIYEQDLSLLISGASSASNGGNYQIEHSLTATNNGPTVLDFSGNVLKFRAADAIAINPDGHNGSTYTYDVVYEVNPLTGELISSTLVASSSAEAVLADEAGFDVDTEISELNRSGASGTFQSYGSNITNAGVVNIETNGGLITEQLSNPDGTSLLRKEDDGTVHIGRNSIVLADELVSASGNDEIYSSSGTLQLGNNDTHKTIIKGTLEVPKPTIGAHAANKDYVDSVGAMAMAASQISLQADPNSSLSLGVGLGGLGSQSAFAIGVTGQPQGSQLRYSLTASYSDYSGSVGYGAALVWSLR